MLWNEDLILHEDKDILVVHKPAGVAVESARVTEMDLISHLRAYVKEKNADADVYMVHRLDQPVEGIVLFAKNSRAAGVLSAELTDGTMKKMYLAHVEGAISKEEAELTDWLVKDPKSNLSKVVPKPAARQKGRNAPKRAVLKYRKVGEQLLEVALMTGRHHQIRVQLSHAGMPISGDGKYGAVGNDGLSLSRGAIALCAYRLTFRHPASNKVLEFQITPSFQDVKCR